MENWRNLPEKNIMIRAGLLWDGINEAPETGFAVEVSEGKIKTVGPAEALLGYPEEHMLDFPGCMIMPGLIDSHTHLSMDGELDNYLDHMADPVAELTLRATAMMSRDLEAGVTSCRCCGDREFLDISCRKAVGEWLVTGPHLLVATRGIRAPAGHGFVGYPFDGVEAIRKAIVENAEAGADFIKIYISGTLRGGGELPGFLSPDEIRAAIDEAHRAGLSITAHCVGGEGLDLALEYGIDCLEHVYHISDRQIRDLKNSGTRVVLTPGPMLSTERIKKLPERLIPGHFNERETIRSRMAAVIASGKPFAVGTDGLHGGLAGEVFYLVEMGATPLQALQAATIQGAIVGGIDEKTGSLEPGKQADLLVLDGNPFVDLSAINRVRAVWKSGRQLVTGRKITAE
jgi:imidazolonepropionase-like amidohydrolase